MQLGSVGTCNVSVSREWDGHGRSVGRLIGRSVGRSVDARGPVDHDSVGLAQARPDYLQQHVLFKIIVTSYTYIIKFTKCLFAVILQWIHTHTRSVDDKITVTLKTSIRSSNFTVSSIFEDML